MLDRFNFAEIADDGWSYIGLAGLAEQIATAATLDGEFVLRSGQVSHRYFDKYRFEGVPVLLKPLARAMSDLLPANTEIIAGLELGGIPLVTSISLETGLPAAFVRKEAKTYGTCRAIEGQDVAGRGVTFIEDVITTGGAVADAYQLASAEGANVLAVVCAIWRGDGTPRIHSVPALSVLPVFSRADLEALDDC
ncbi:orotate phosphoribosyltransferase [Rhizobium gallicum]|uniref:orotate phosphoribosyltransferase n=1 Tax=Rhizobium gallicum TaxID=56730 RepID=UPI001EF7EE24|nr:orotate phosphoribosyltransferase [Rhizobium gallicum]ULJ73687.1 orotate phosphoribosyltransferase [Rhizobium gallicum]